MPLPLQSSQQGGQGLHAGGTNAPCLVNDEALEHGQYGFFNRICSDGLDNSNGRHGDCLPDVKLGIFREFREHWQY